VHDPALPRYSRLHEPARYRIQLVVYRPTFLAFSLRRHHNVRYLQRRRLTRQRKHLVYSDPRSDCGIAQARFANLLGHSLTAKRGYGMKVLFCDR
jgi:hypothetical protein